MNELIRIKSLKKSLENIKHPTAKAEDIKI